MRHSLNSVVSVDFLIECTTAVLLEVVTFRRLHLSGISAANTDGVVISI
jgi:hypothetical protein